MSAIAPVASVNAVLAVQRQMALENALIAQRTPIVIDLTFGPAVIVDLSPAAQAFLTFRNRDDNDTFLFAELLSTLVVAETAAARAATAR